MIILQASNLDTIANPYTIGIVSGLVASLLASFLIWIFYRFFNDFLLPKYQEMIYKGVMINGKIRYIIQLVRKELKVL